jgi:hypothetical protein
MVLATMAALWPRLFVVLPLLGISVGFTAVEAGLSASGTAGPAPRRPLSNRLLTVALHLLQPIARFVGRWTGSLTPLRRHGARRRAWPLPGVRIVWSERWHSEVEWLSALETHARAAGARIRRGGPHDRWDVEVRDGELGGMRVLLGIEEHGAGRQLLRFRLRPRVAPAAALVMSTATVLGGVSLTQQAWTAGAVLFGGLALLAIGTVRQWSAGAGATLDALDALHEDPATAPLEADEEWASDVEGEMGATLPHPDEAGNPVGVADGVLRPDPLGASPSRGQTSADPRVSL